MVRAAVKANLGAEEGYRSRPTTALRRVPERRSSSQYSQSDISEHRQFSPQEQAAIRFAISLVQGKWKVGILCRLQEGPARLGDLRRLFPQASKKMLTQHLRQMEQYGIITRIDLSGKMPHVEYSLSDSLGRAIAHLIDFLANWGGKHFPTVWEWRSLNKPRSSSSVILTQAVSGPRKELKACITDAIANCATHAHTAVDAIPIDQD